MKLLYYHHEQLTNVVLEELRALTTVCILWTRNDNELHRG